MSRLRAVETGRDVLVDRHQRHQRGGPRRRVGRGRAPEKVARTLVAEVPLRDGQTLATRLGAWPEWLLAGCALLAAVGVAVLRRRRDQRARRGRPVSDVETHGGLPADVAARRRRARGGARPTTSGSTSRTSWPAGARGGAAGARPGGRRQQPGRHRGARRRRSPRPTRQVHVLHRRGEGGARRGVPRRVRLGSRARLRRAGRDGRRRLAPARAAARRCCAALPAPTSCSARAGCPAGSVVNWPRAAPAALAGRQHLRPAGAADRACATRPAGSARSGVRPWRRSTCDGVASHGYCFQVDLAWRAVQAGLRVVEVPIEFVERVHGASKMSGDIVREALWRVTVGVPGCGPTRLRGRADRREEVSRGGLVLLVLVFLVMPVVEIYVIIQVGQVIGAAADRRAAAVRERARRLAGQARGRPGLARAAGRGRRRSAAQPASSPTPAWCWSAARCC